MTSPFKNPVLSWDEATEMAQNCRDKGGIVVTTNGCFDLLHAGHVQYLSYARQLGDILLVAINTDDSVKRIKGPKRPINNEESRAFVLSALKSVDGVCIFSEETPVEWLKTVKPHIHVKGSDWDITKIPEAKVLETWGGRVQAAPFTEGFSTTKLIEKSKGV